jgi:hypothetical protein
MQAAFSTRTKLFSLLPALPLPPSHPPPINAIREASAIVLKPRFKIDVVIMITVYEVL